MKIYLLKTPEFSAAELQPVIDLLDTFEGPLVFQKIDYAFDLAQFPFLQKYYPDFTFKYPTKNTKIHYHHERGLPLSWRELFSLCSFYRETFEIDSNDFIVLLTNRRNALNWFSAFDAHRHIFVHGNEWDSYTNANPKYPIAYQIVENILQFLMKLDINDPTTPYFHRTPKGCMNDFCNNKEEIILKLQTANICDHCMEAIHNAQVDATIVEQAFQIFEGVRNELIFKKRVVSKKETSPYPLTITANHKIIIEKLNVEIRLTPLHKTLFLFFLQQQEGILLKELVDHKPVLLKLYTQFSVSDNAKENELRINTLVNPSENSFTMIKTKINKTITDLLGKELAKYYKIEGKRAQPFHIQLSKSLIQYQH
ncbi:MAG: hypothetical protein RIR12_2253 [Bacteroidota bacterium]|jgi:hypothetical protein